MADLHQRLLECDDFKPVPDKLLQAAKIFRHLDQLPSRARGCLGWSSGALAWLDVGAGPWPYSGVCYKGQPRTFGEDAEGVSARAGDVRQAVRDSWAIRLLRDKGMLRATESGTSPGVGASTRRRQPGSTAVARIPGEGPGRKAQAAARGSTGLSGRHHAQPNPAFLVVVPSHRSSPVDPPGLQEESEGGLGSPGLAGPDSPVVSRDPAAEPQPLETPPAHISSPGRVVSPSAATMAAITRALSAVDTGAEGSALEQQQQRGEGAGLMHTVSNCFGPDLKVTRPASDGEGGISLEQIGVAIRA